MGEYKNGGREYRRRGGPSRSMYTTSKRVGSGEPIWRVRYEGQLRVGECWGSAPYIGVSVESIRRWWNSVGYERYSQARELFITADCGGSNGYRTRLWKLELQRLADELGGPDHRMPLSPGHQQVE